MWGIARQLCHSAIVGISITKNIFPELREKRILLPSYSASAFLERTAPPPPIHIGVELYRLDIGGIFRF